MLNYMNKNLTINFKDALLLFNVHFLIGPKKCRVSYQLLAFIRTGALALLNAKDAELHEQRLDHKF